MRRRPLLPLALSIVVLITTGVPVAGADRPPAAGDPSQAALPDGSPAGLTGDPTLPADPALAPDASSPPGATGTPLVSVPSPPAGAQPPPALPRPVLTRRRTDAIAAGPALSGPTVAGLVGAILPSGRAAPPAGAPRAVKVLMWTANRLIGLPYRYGGGHASFADRAYDCSGAVSYALHAAGLLAFPEDSTSLEKWGGRGAGRWVTVYANRGHAWLVVAGVRLDTSSVADPVGLDGPRWRPAVRPAANFRVRHPLAV